MKKLFTFILLLILSAGCRMPDYTVGLDAVVRKEILARRSGSEKFRCTMGAHRGDSVRYMENTIDALKAAATNDNYAFVEFDLQYSADDRIVLFHDKGLRRLFGKSARIGERTFAELQELSGGQIASYSNAMSIVEGMKLNMEIKSQGDLAEDKRLVDFIVEDIDRRGISDDVVLSSISADVVRYINDKYPDIATGQIFWIKSSTFLPLDALTKALYRDIQETRADYLMLHVSNLHNINDLLKLKPRGKTIVFWAFDDAMYLVHKNFSDRIWGESRFKTWLDNMRYLLWRRSLRKRSGGSSKTSGGNGLKIEGEGLKVPEYKPDK